MPAVHRHAAATRDMPEHCRSTWGRWRGRARALVSLTLHALMCSGGVSIQRRWRPDVRLQLGLLRNAVVLRGSLERDLWTCALANVELTLQWLRVLQIRLVHQGALAVQATLARSHSAAGRGRGHALVCLFARLIRSDCMSSKCRRRTSVHVQLWIFRDADAWRQYLVWGLLSYFNMNQLIV